MSDTPLIIDKRAEHDPNEADPTIAVGANVNQRRDLVEEMNPDGVGTNQDDAFIESSRYIPPSKVLDQLYELRKKILSDPLSYRKWANDPVGFNEVVLRGFFWSKQKEICNAVVKNRRVCVPSCHDVGKSALAARLVAWWICAHDPEDVFVVTLAPTWRQVRAILWREIGQLHKKYGLIGRPTQMTWLINEQLVGFGVSPADHDPVALQGIHARNVLVIFDEACGIERNLWEAADSLIANENSRILVIGNPDDPASHFATVSKPGSGWHTIHVDAFESPNLTGEPIPEWLAPLLISKTWVEEKRKSWGEHSPLWVSKVRGQFPEVGDDTLISSKWVRDAQERKTRAAGKIELGVDIARFGNDTSIIFYRQGHVTRIYAELHNRDLMVVAGTVVRAVLDLGATSVKLDDAGLGGGVVDRLREAQKEHTIPKDVKIIAINAGESPTRKKLAEKFLNLRAELYWSLRERFQAGEIVIPKDEELANQLISIKYDVDSKGRIKIESKSDMKARGLPSPDKADALMLAFARGEAFEPPEWLSRPLSSPVFSIFAR